MHFHGLIFLPLSIIEQHHEKTGIFAFAKTKVPFSFAVTAQLISAFVFRYTDIFLNLKFQASSYLL